MEFKKVEKIHILQGIKDFEEKGLPNGFGPSSTFDLVYEGKRYPPKAVMVYANYSATEREIENYFKGGEDTDCFKAFERNGFKLIRKSIKVMNEKLYNLKDDFLKEWPIERLKTMTLEEYTNLDKTSFCYWLEQKTELLGGIRGGSSYKFGVYRMAENSDTKSVQNRMNDGVYAWHLKYGKTKEEVFENIRNTILKICEFSLENKLKKINNIDLGDAYKWKIAFLYSDYKIFNIFNRGALDRILIGLGQKVEKSLTISEINQTILQQKPIDEDYFTFAKRMWNNYGKENPKAGVFEKWLRKNETKNSRKVGSYLRAIDILTNHFKIKIYEEENLSILNTLYQDLKEHQGEINGKYYYSKAPSYGVSRFYSAAIKAYVEFYQNTLKTKNISTKEEKSIMGKTMNLNKILYGPPGTGKTYKTISDAISIINPTFDLNQERDAVKKEYQRLTDEGNIVFTTFHQSMSYEDFIEGIKPVLNQEDNNISYEIKEGVFKAIADKAKGIEGEIRTQTEKVDLKKVNFFKMSIGGKNRKDTHDWCINNNMIALGYGGKNDLNQIATTNWKEYKKQFENTFTDIVEDSSYSIRATYYFKNTIQKGDVVLISLGNHIIDAIGVVKSDYKYLESTEVPYHHFRDVEWIATNLNANPNLFLDKKISQQTIYQFDNNDVKINYLESILNKKVSVDTFNKQNYVLIIDEINRGNVSAIFGELITLLEPDKRLGAKEELKVKLPYSKDESFGVPSNLYIIGTMNTADRSVEALDTALRRRFVFEEVMPKPKLLTEIIFEGFNLELVLKLINQRIEALLDRDHTIGHSYFIKLESSDTEGLSKVFENNIIPLLQEYFYNDYEKIALVLGEGFVKEKEILKNIFPKFNKIDEPEINVGFELITPINDIELALRLLLGKENE